MWGFNFFQCNQTRKTFATSLLLIITVHITIEFDHGAIVRGDINKKQIALVFTADEFADGGKTILTTLEKQQIKASLFFTGRFYRNSAFKSLITQAKRQGH